MNENPTDNKTVWKKRLFWRKARLYILWAASLVVCVVLSFQFFNTRFTEMIGPQITRAYVEIADQAPALLDNEAFIEQLYREISVTRLRAARDGIALPAAATDNSLYKTLEKGLEDAAAAAAETSDLVEQNDDSEEDDALVPASNAQFEELKSLFSIDDAIWPKVGRNGIVVLANRFNGTVAVHPNEDLIGSPLLVSSLRSVLTGLKSSARLSDSDAVQTVELSTFLTNPPKDLFKVNHYFVYPDNLWKNGFVNGLRNMLLASVVTYDNYYIICGVDSMEYFVFVSKALVISLLAWALMGLFVYYICLLLDRHEADAVTLRRQLMAYGAILVVVIFGLSWYIQVLNDATDDLLTMQKNADNAANTMTFFRSSQSTINSWLDEQYLIQCQIAAGYIQSMGRDTVTRKDLAELSEKLKVQYIYLFDQTGAVRVTNSPYDHLKISEQDTAPSHAFQALLAGADHVIQPPMPDEVTGRRTQFIGVSLRNAEDLADGFVQIAIDPSIRNRLTSQLDVQTVLDAAVVGLPEQLLAIDKKDLTISATTGAGYVGMPVANVNITQEQLGAAHSGFIDFNDRRYYAGFAEDDDLYIVAFMSTPDHSASFYISLKIALVALITLALVILLAVLRYQEDVLDTAPEPEPEPPEPRSEPKEPDDFRFLRLHAVQEKKGFEKRWGTLEANTNPTPGMKVWRIALNLLILLCVAVLVPLVVSRLKNPGDASGLFGLTYVISGHWQKGVNLFALSSIAILLFALSIFNTLATRFLYTIAKSADLRTETICLMLRSSLKYISILVFIYYGLSRLGIPTQALLASAGIITLAVSMGARDLLNDIIAGLFILVEGNIKVGDFVQVGPWKGNVREIGIHTTKVVSGNETKIFNNSSLRDVINVVPEETRSMTLSVPVAVNASLTDIEAMLAEELPGLESAIPGLVEAPKYEGIDKLEDGCMYVRISIKTGSKHSAAFRELNRQVKLMFERRGIEIPVKQLYVRQVEGTFPIRTHEEAVSHGKEKA